jgi:hypothetical protein
MVSCGYEARPSSTASVREGLLGHGARHLQQYRDAHALKLLNDFASQQPHRTAHRWCRSSSPSAPGGDQRMTAEVQKYTLEQVEALELAPGAEHENLEGWVPALATDDDCARLSKRRSTIAAT